MNRHHETRYMVYYGPNRINELLSYDVVIIEPRHHRTEDIRLLKAAQVRSYAYLSFFEAAGDLVPADVIRHCSLRSEGILLSNPVYQNPYMDLTDDVWQHYLLQRIDHLITGEQFDGIFIDTAGNIEDPRLSDNLMYRQIRGLCDILQIVKKKYPNIFLMQNNGLEILIDNTAEYLNAVCWENPNPDDQHRELNAHIIRQIAKIRHQKPLEVLLVSDQPDFERYLRDIAQKQQYAVCITGKDYLLLDISG